MIISIGGFMATGKSTVGRHLAESLTWPFVDLDAVIETRANNLFGLGIPELFAQGEEHFRRVERDCLLELLNDAGPRDELVLSLGGGTLHNAHLADVVLAKSTLFVLHASWSVVAGRIQQSNRPLKASSEALFERRQAGYCIGETINVDGLTVAAIVAQITQCLSTRGVDVNG